jgi:hypothetical protein
MYKEIKLELPVTRTSQTLKDYYSKFPQQTKTAIDEFVGSLPEGHGPMSYHHARKHIIQNHMEGAGLADIFKKVQSIFNRSKDHVKNAIVHGKHVVQNFRKAYDDSKESIKKAKDSIRETYKIVREELADAPTTASASEVASDITERLADSVIDLGSSASSETTSGGYKRRTTAKKRKGGFAIGGSAVYDT